jgi:hypothetical protein
LIAAFAAMAVASACADAAAINSNAPLAATPDSPAGPVFVMAPVWRTNETGNVGRDFRAINDQVTARILAIVRERFPRAQIVEAQPRDVRQVMPGYPVAVDVGAELNAAARAYEHGAAYLLVPTITEWKEVRTDDPIGAFIRPHNSVAMTLRLMRLHSPAVSGRASFKNHARLTLNQPAERLLDGRFHDVVLHLVAGPS